VLKNCLRNKDRQFPSYPECPVIFLSLTFAFFDSFIIVLNYLLIIETKTVVLDRFRHPWRISSRKHSNRSPEVPLYPWYEHSPSQNHVQPVVKYVLSCNHVPLAISDHTELFFVSVEFFQARVIFVTEGGSLFCSAVSAVPCTENFLIMVI